MQKLVRTFARAAALVALAAPAISAQKRDLASDEKELASYRLTTEGLKKFRVVIEAMADFAKKDPEVRAHVKLQAAVDSLRAKEELTESEQARLEKLEQQLERADESTETKDDETFSEMAESLARLPGVAGALRRAGMTPREYILFSLALIQASAYASMQKSGLIKDVPKEANAANIKFAEDHAAELKVLHAEVEKLNNQFGKKGS